MGTSLERRRPLRGVILKLILQESDVGDDVLDRGNIMCEGPKTGRSWVFIRNKENRYGYSPGGAGGRGEDGAEINQWRSALPRSRKAFRATRRCLDFMPSPWEALRSGICSKAVTLAAWGKWHEGKLLEQ